MLITNLTNSDYWFGPLHLPAGAGTSTLTVDDSSSTSLYLTNDAVADAIISLNNAGKISVSGVTSGINFPRATGSPSVMHGDGSPEGLIYAPQGSMYMRRDAASTTGYLFTKTTGVTQNTGWALMSTGGGAVIYERRSTAVDVNTTTSEKSLYDGSVAGSTTGWTISGGDMATNKTYRLSLFGDYLYNNANTDTLILRVKFNNIVMWQGTIIPASSVGLGANRHPWTCVLNLSNLGAANSQDVHGVFTTETGNTGAPTTGRGIIDVVNSRLQGGTLSGTGSVDTSVQQKFDVTVQWSASSANDSFKLINAVSELL